MKVTVSVGGRFHAFNLAHELERHGALGRLITSYPKNKAALFGVPREKIASVLRKEIADHSWGKLPEAIRSRFNPQFSIHELFDQRAADLVPRETDIFTGWSSFSLHALRRAKSYGAKIVVERGSSHILYQEEILKEERERWGVPLEIPHPKIVEKELKEYEEADAIAIPSLFVKWTFLSYGFPESKLIHVPYGVDLSSFRQVPKEDGIFRVIFVGGMTLRKGVHYLLQAFSQLKLPNAELLLVGSMNPEMKTFFKKYEGTFRYMGHVPQGELYKYYSHASVFAMCSIEEGLAMVQAQAMACRLPLIITSNTGGEDLVRDGKDGFVIPIRDTEALKEKILWMYEHPAERAAMGISAKERVAQGFTWGDYGNKIVSAYGTLLDVHPFEGQLNRQGVRDE